MYVYFKRPVNNHTADVNKFIYDIPSRQSVDNVYNITLYAIKSGNDYALFFIVPKLTIFQNMCS